MKQRLRYYFSNLVAVSFVGIVFYSGFAYPLHYGRGFWPFNCDWFMFSYDTGYDFELQAVGKMPDGTSKVLDVSPYFSLQIGANSDRFQEIARDVVNMRRLAEYLCPRFNVQSITLQEVTWPRTTGQIPPDKIDARQKTTSPWVTDVPCGS